jgi:hypothetical protein
MWSPDGGSLLVLEDSPVGRRHRGKDTVTKLPWPADSMPSWQRVVRCSLGPAGELLGGASQSDRAPLQTS